MSLYEKLERIAFKRELKRAQKHFARVAAKADRMRMPKKAKRSLFKTMLRAAGYKKIRIKELINPCGD